MVICFNFLDLNSLPISSSHLWLSKGNLTFYSTFTTWNRADRQQFRSQLEKMADLDLEKSQLYWLKAQTCPSPVWNAHFSKACYILGSCLPEIHWTNLPIMDQTLLKPGCTVVTYSEKFSSQADDHLSPQYNLAISQLCFA